MASLSFPISIPEVNSLSDEQFESVFGNVIELCTDPAVKVKMNRPFESVTSLCDAFQTYLEELSLEDKLKVLKLHPDLAGRLAALGELTPESAGEQRAAGLGDLKAEQKSVLDESNQRESVQSVFVIGYNNMKMLMSIDLDRSNYSYSLFTKHPIHITGNNTDFAEVRYIRKFGFPFIICARENKVQSIIDGLQQRYHNSYEQEITTGINEVKKICRLRTLDIVKN